MGTRAELAVAGQPARRHRHPAARSTATLPMDRGPRRVRRDGRRRRLRQDRLHAMTATHLVTGAGVRHRRRRWPARLHERGDDLVLLARSEERAARAARPTSPARTMLVADLADPAALDGARPARCRTAGLGGPRRRRRRPRPGRRAAARTTGASSSTSTWSRRRCSPARSCPPCARPAGTVVFVNSSAGLTASPTWSAYAASKFGLRALADALRAEEVEHGVRVTTVYPEPDRHADAGEGARAGGRGPTTPSRWIAPETVVATILHVLDLPRRRDDPRGDRPAGRAAPGT